MDKVHANGRSYIPEVETIEDAGKLRSACPPGQAGLHAEEAVNVAEEIGYPVVLKVVSDDIIHKSDVKGVELNLGSAKRSRKHGTGFTSMSKQPCPRLPFLDYM